MDNANRGKEIHAKNLYFSSKKVALDITKLYSWLKNARNLMIS